MCVALEEMRKESRLEGEIKGVVETYKEVGFSIQETIQRISDKFNLSLQQAEDKVKKHWKL